MTLRVLFAHNAYIHRGGEEVVVDAEVLALREAGLTLDVFQPRNAPSWQTALGALQAPWGGGEEAHLEQRLMEFKPDILHVHNLYPQLSPRIFSVAHKLGIKTVATFHNFRPLCLNGLFLTPAKEVCERCSGGNYWHGIIRGCYRESRLQSAALATHLALAAKHQWYSDVDRYIAPTRFLRDKLVAGGFPAEKIVVQGNFLPEFPPVTVVQRQPYILFMGRLSEEKGLPWLLDLFLKPPLPLRLVIAGTGPLENHVRSKQSDSVQYVGFISGSEKAGHIAQASAIVLASDCYENHPLVIMEANAYGVPVMVADQGGMAELVTSGINGEKFAAHNATSFWQAASRLGVDGPIAFDPKRIRDDAEKRFSKNSFVKTRVNLYTQLVAPS